MNAMEIKVKLLLIFVLKVFDLSSNQGSEIHRIIEYQVWRYLKDHLNQRFSIKIWSRQDGPASYPDES